VFTLFRAEGEQLFVVIILKTGVNWR